MELRVNSFAAWMLPATALTAPITMTFAQWHPR